MSSSWIDFLIIVGDPNLGPSIYYDYFGVDNPPAPEDIQIQTIMVKEHEALYIENITVDSTIKYKADLVWTPSYGDAPNVPQTIFTRVGSAQNGFELPPLRIPLLFKGSGSLSLVKTNLEDPSADPATQDARTATIYSTIYAYPVRKNS